MNKNDDKQVKNKGHRWSKGETGNPKGRPPKPSCLTSLLKEDLIKIDEKTGKTKAQLLAEAMVKDAIGGSASARAEIFERVEGKVTQPIGGANGEPIALNIVVNSKATKDTLDSIANKV